MGQSERSRRRFVYKGTLSLPSQLLHALLLSRSHPARVSYFLASGLAKTIMHLYPEDRNYNLGYWRQDASKIEPKVPSLSLASCECELFLSLRLAITIIHLYPENKNYN